MESNPPASKPVSVAVVTGGHGFDVLNFHKLFRELEGVDAYIHHTDEFVTSPAEVRQAYDVVLFFSFFQQTPTDEDLPWYQGKPEAVLEALGDTAQGIFVLHHAILAYGEWPFWDRLVGLEGRSFGYHIGEDVHVEIATPDHPITRGLQAWDMVDETYTTNNASDDNEILLTMDHPKSMKTIAWTRQHRNARVFCLQSGHDNQTWVEPNFREILRRGILWCARQI